MGGVGSFDGGCLGAMYLRLVHAECAQESASVREDGARPKPRTHLTSIGCTAWDLGMNPLVENRDLIFTQDRLCQ
jgi:hypothetical protein